eukprot:TRINITY_DN106907_c0_g1_i1.p1 TRINITY_DN106907_c0_g1~~TRINITY_DN106907_c0_g1_i1.p1  ORF type:complete len:126 (+),score=20.35 TRINITY_DN106907_c0_g1_i1:91-468(+)
MSRLLRVAVRFSIMLSQHQHVSTAPPAGRLLNISDGSAEGGCNIFCPFTHQEAGVFSVKVVGIRIVRCYALEQLRGVFALAHFLTVADGRAANGRSLCTDTLRGRKALPRIAASLSHTDAFLNPL